MGRRRRYDISVQIDEPFDPSLSEEWLVGIARRVLTVEGLPSTELGIVITDDETIRTLNRHYAGIDESTDVLSFSLTEGEPFVWPDNILRLGEVIISYPTAVRQAEEGDRPVEAEVAHLLIHGVLHLLGYNHLEPSDERLMRGKEEALLRASLEEL